MTQFQSLPSRLARFFGTSRHTALPLLRRRVAQSPLTKVASGTSKVASSTAKVASGTAKVASSTAKVASSTAKVASKTQPLGARIFWLACGSIMIGTSVALLVKAGLGLPAYDVLASALAKRLGLTLGQSGWLLAATFFSLAALLGRRASPWGLAYVVGNGLAIDAITGLVNSPQTLVGQVAFLAASIVVMAGGVNLVLHSGTTGGPFELLMLAGEDRGVSKTKVRYGLDIGVLVSGVLLGGDFGVGTVVHAAAFGAVLALVSRALDDHRAGRRQRLAANTGLTAVDDGAAKGAASVADTVST